MATTEQPLSIVDGRLYALGGSVAVDGRVSWYPPSWRGHTPVNSYLLVEDGAGVLIDSNVTVNEQIVLEQLRSLKLSSISIVHTRIVELDPCCNTGAIMRHFPVDRLYGHLTVRHFVHFGPHLDEEPQDEDGPAWARDPIAPETLFDGGSQISVGSTERGRDRLTVISPALRLLGTAWLYDRETKTLFTSDSFGYAISPEPTGPALLAPEDDDVTLDRITEFVHEKFDWLDRADATHIRERQAEQLAEFDIERIAPGYGLVIEGREQAARHLDMVLESIDRTPQRVSA